MTLPVQDHPRLDVSVAVMFTADMVKPLAIVLPDNKKYNIQRITDIRAAPSERCGGFGTRYTCRVEDKLLHLYRDGYERNRWYIDLSTVEEAAI